MVLITRPQPLGGCVDSTHLPDTAVFAIGDIHGQWRPLTALLAAMNATPTGNSTRVLLTLGDTLHKGPRSRRVLRAALSDEITQRAGVDAYHPLLGNHEILFARALIALDRGEMSWLGAWYRAGGDTLLTSWKNDRTGTIAARLARWRDAFPASLETMGRWGHTWHQDGLVGVHAGLSPHADWSAMGALDAYTLMRGRPVKHPQHWATVRAPFLDWTGGFGGRLILHGHTPPRSFFRRPPRRAADLTQTLNTSATLGRVCLDGGAGFGIGVAGALIHDQTIRFFFSPCP